MCCLDSAMKVVFVRVNVKVCEHLGVGDSGRGVLDRPGENARFPRLLDSVGKVPCQQVFLWCGPQDSTVLV